MKLLRPEMPGVRMLIRGLGKQRTFEEWLPEVPRQEFELLFCGSIGHFYMRAHHMK